MYVILLHLKIDIMFSKLLFAIYTYSVFVGKTSYFALSVLIIFYISQKILKIVKLLLCRCGLLCHNVIMCVYFD